MVQGFVSPGSSATGFYVTSFLQGNANRYYRANQLGSYVQDKFQVTPTLSLTAGCATTGMEGLPRSTAGSSTSISARRAPPTAYCYTIRETPGNPSGFNGLRATTLTPPPA
jgi:hypothetical protein